MTAPWLPGLFGGVAAVTLLLCTGLLAPLAGVNAEGREWTVEGIVRRAGRPVPGATIRVSGPVLAAGTTSDAAGRFLLKGTFPGTYTISAEAEGTGGAAPVTLQMNPGSARRGVAMELKDEAVLAGAVTNPARRPVSGATVLAWVKSSAHGGASFVTKGFDQTNDLGEFRITELPEGRYRLVAVLPPLRPARVAPESEATKPNQTRPGSARFAFFPSSTEWESAAVLSIPPGVKREALDLTLPMAPVYRATLEVPPPSGFIAGPQAASLTILTPAGGAFLQVARGSVQTGEAWEVRGLPAGTYKAVAITFDTASKRTTGFGKVEFTISRSDVDLGSLPVLPAVTQTGLLHFGPKDPQQSRPEGLAVTLSARNRPIYYGENRAARFVDGGRFVIEGAFQDDYAITVSGLPSGCYLKDASQEGRDVLRSQVHAGAGEINLTIGNDGPRVSGRTVDGEGAPVAGAALALIEEESGRMILARSDIDGRYEFWSGVAPGRHTLIAIQGLMAGEESDEEVFRQQRSRGTSLLLSPGELRNFDVVVQTVQRQF